MCWWVRKGKQHYAEWEDFSDLKNSVQSPRNTEAGRKPLRWPGTLILQKWKLGQSTYPAQVNERGESPNPDLLIPGVQYALPHSKINYGGFILAQESSFPMSVAWFVYLKVLKQVVALKRTCFIFLMVLFMLSGIKQMLPENALQVISKVGITAPVHI